jgi:hypothetical protein
MPAITGGTFGLFLAIGAFSMNILITEKHIFKGNEMPPEKSGKKRKNYKKVQIF